MTRTLQLSREMWIFLGVTTAMSFVYLYMMTGESARLRVGKVPDITPTEISASKPVDVAITLITADAFGLACSSDQAIGAEHCAFKADGTPWKAEAGTPEAKPENIIAPYMTVDNVLFLIPGLFQEPLLKKRLDDENPTKFTRDQLEERRFTVTCKLKPEEKMKDIKVRWQPSAGWGPHDPAWAGRVSDCKFTGG